MRSSKTAVCVALCRGLANMDVKVAPFKAVTVLDGPRIESQYNVPLDLGILHHCRAARVCFRPDMNPIVAVKDSGGSCRVYIEGSLCGDVPLLNEDTPILKHLGESRQDQARKAIKSSIDRIQSEYEVMVIEGASSPFDLPEQDDIANVFVAREARLPILLSSLFSRGGSVPALIGSGICLPPDLRTFFKGFLLSDVPCDPVVTRLVQYIEKHLGVPCVGTIPHLPNIWTESEDNVKANEQAYEMWGATIMHTLSGWNTIS